MPNKNAGLRPRILIDCSVVTPVVDGLSIYVINLLKHLPQESFDEFDFALLVLPNLDRPDFWAAIDGRPFKIIEEKVAPIGPRRDWDMYRFFKSRRGDFDLVHITSNNYPVVLKGGICTIHDVAFRTWFHNPGNIPGARQAAVAYMSWIIRRCLRRAARIIADSDATRQDLRTLFQATPAQMDKIDVVHLGWEHLLAGDPAIPAERLPYSDRRFLFFLGSFRPHKNLAGLLDGFEAALDELPEDVLLVIGGSSNRLSASFEHRVRRINKHQERVLFTGYLSDADVARHYAQAEAFVFPSLKEGFGIPVLEAFHYGVPLLCSDRSSLAEVAGDAALLFDPTDPLSIGRALVHYFRHPELRDGLISRGRERLKAFSWRKTAEQTLAIYRAHSGPARG